MQVIRPQNNPKLLWLTVCVFATALLIGIVSVIGLIAVEQSDIDPLVAWHGRLMLFAWAILSPFGILAAKFFKVLPWQNWPEEVDNPAWWHAHRYSHYVTGLVVMSAFALILSAPADPGRSFFTHKVLGYGVLALAGIQFVGGWLRGTKGGPTAPAADGSLFGDHYNMTRRRRVFELVHKSNGYLTVILAAVALLTGLHAADAPHWMWSAIVLWWITFGSLVLLLTKRWRAIETYQAIWGVEPSHPGNRTKPGNDSSSL